MVLKNKKSVLQFYVFLCHITWFSSNYKTPGHQYPQCWLHINWTGPVSYKDTFMHYVYSKQHWQIKLHYENTLRPRQDGRHFTDNIFKCIFLNENMLTLLKISLKLVFKIQMNNIPALVHIMAWRQTGDKPLSEAKMVSFLMHISPSFWEICNVNNRVTKNDTSEVSFLVTQFSNSQSQNQFSISS